MNVQDIAKYFKIIRKWWWVIVLLSGFTVGTMLAIAFLTEPQYEAKVTIQVSAPPPQEAPLYSSFDREAVRDEVVQTQNSLSEFLKEGNAAVRALETLPDISMTAGELREKLTVEIPDNSSLMRISVLAPEPKTAALLANTVVEVGLRQYGQLRAQPTTNARLFIERELEVARAELKTAEAELAQFRISNKVGDLNEGISKQYDLIRSLSLNRDLARAEGDLAKMQEFEKIILEREVGLQDMIGLSAEYNELADHVTRARATFSFLLDRRSAAQIKENQILGLDSIQIITSARPPQRPVTAIDNKIIVLGGIVSFMGGILLTFLLEYLQISGSFQGSQKRFERPEAITLPDGAMTKAYIE